MKHLIISAVNIVEAGTLEILRSCLHSASVLEGWHVTALIHSKNLFDIDGIRYIEFKNIKSSWLKRIWFEYVRSKSISKDLQPDFWLSMHDITPNLSSTLGKIPQAVYCHNAMCFYDLSIKEIIWDPKQLIFSKLYSTLYKINLHKNSLIIVQQNWLRNEFSQRLNYSGKIVVAHPESGESPQEAKKITGTRFFYPSYPRVFKNFETLLEAWKIVSLDPGWDGELVVTLNEESSSYAKALIKHYGSLSGVRYIGTVDSKIIHTLYKEMDCLIFPSKLETWGLPISEAKQNGLYIIAADLPYAHETVGEYNGASFFNSNDPIELARLIRNFRAGEIKSALSTVVKPSEPFVPSWNKFFSEVLK